MNRYIIAPLALRDLQSIWDYIGIENDSPAAADRQLQRFDKVFELLANNPLMGEQREDLRPGLRIFVAGNYVVLYYPMDKGIEVVGVVHGARHVESMFRHGER